MSTSPESVRARATRVRLLELVRFGLVGASSTLIYLGVYAAAVLAGVPFAAASVAGFLVSAGCGYVLHDRWTFRTNTPSRGGLSRWLVLQGTVLGLNILVLWVLVAQAGLDRLLAQVIVLPLLPLATYVLSRRRVFGAE